MVGRERPCRETSTKFFFNVSSLSTEGLLGLPGRCFLLNRPEWTPSVCCYRPLEYPRLASAIECQVHSTMALPIYLGDPAVEPQMPFGVLEVLLDHQTTNLGHIFEFMHGVFCRNGRVRRLVLPFSFLFPFPVRWFSLFAFDRLGLNWRFVKSDFFNSVVVGLS